MRKAVPFFHFILAFVLVSSYSCQTTTKSHENERIKKRNEALRQIHAPSIPAYTLDITAFGAKGDSVTDCKPAFDKAMKACEEQKGAKIIVPAGCYFVNGPIHLVSNVNLELKKGSVLKFGTDPEKYLPTVLTSWEGTFLYNYSPFIYGYRLENISITGEGTIDGNAKDSFSKWSDKQKDDQELSRKMNHENTPLKDRIFGKGHYLRPQLIQLMECKNILIEGVTITNSPFWCVHLLKSENVTIRGVSYNAHNKNNDGVDPEYTKNVLIENVNFDNGDDNVAIKAGRDHEGRATAIASENIIIRNCRFKGLHGVVVGSEMSAGVRNVFVENCTSAGYCKRGIFLKSNPDRGGFISDIYVNNVKFGDVEDCFFITSYYHGEGKGFSTDIHDVYVDSMSCRKASNAGIVVQGYPQKKVRDIYFSNFSVDSASIGLSLTNAEHIMMSDVTIGGVVSVPSSVK